jgi:hypothetical protein
LKTSFVLSGNLTLSLSALLLLLTAVASIPPQGAGAAVCYQLKPNGITCGSCGVTSCDKIECRPKSNYGWECTAAEIEQVRLEAASLGFNICDVKPYGQKNCDPGPTTTWCTQNRPCDTSSLCSLDPVDSKRYCTSVSTPPSGGRCGITPPVLSGGSCPGSS